jgi:lipopolysaccharide exporter
MSSPSQAFARVKSRVSQLLPTGGLKQSVFRGGVWLGAGSTTEQAFRFLRNMILTRILVPEAFGLMAIVLSATTLIQVMVDVGASQALIQNRKGSQESHVRAAWWLALTRSVGLYAIIYAAAPFIGRFYANGELTGLARIAMLSIVFEGAISPLAYVAVKEMKFRKWAAVANGGGIIGVAVAIGLSFVLRDVWALAIGFLSENAARCILSFILCPWTPRIPENLDAMRDLWKFSKGLVGLAFLNLIFIRADIFVLGKLYSAAQLGIYTLGIYLIQTPVVFITDILSQTLFPAFSRIQDDHERMNRILVKATSAIVLVGLPAVVFLVFCGRSLLTILYGHRYGEASTALAVAACAALCSILNALITIAFYAKGQPQLHRRAVAAMAVVVVALIYPLTKEFGLWGAQVACLVANIVGYVLQLERMHKITKLNLLEYAKDFTIPAGISMGAVVIWMLARYALPDWRPIPTILFGGFVCLMAYGALLGFSLQNSKRAEACRE